MSALRRSRTIGISIDAPFGRVYEFVSDANQLPKWAHGLGANPVPDGPNRWLVSTSAGPMHVEFVEPNALGVVDHVVTPVGGGASVDVPLRVLANGGGSEVILTLFQQQGMTDEQFEKDAAMVADDLARLRTCLEGSAT